MQTAYGVCLPVLNYFRSQIVTDIKTSNHLITSSFFALNNTSSMQYLLCLVVMPRVIPNPEASGSGVMMDRHVSSQGFCLDFLYLLDN